MLSFTASATTVKLEQKAKTEIVKGFEIQKTQVGVVTDLNFDFVKVGDFEMLKRKLFYFESKRLTGNQKAILDVGWNLQRKINYKNLKSPASNCNLEFVHPLIRDPSN